MRLIDHYRWGRVQPPAMSIRLDLLILVFLLFASASLVALSGAAAHAQESQTRKIYRIGFLRAGQPPTAWVEAFQQGLREQGYVDGRNLVVEFRVTDGSGDALPRLAEELVRSKIDVILASSGPPALAAKKATTSVPIVFVNVSDPVAIGLVRSLGSPGGNITGLTMTSDDLTGKRLELLRELLGLKLRRVAVLSHPPTPSNRIQIKEAEVAARTLGLQLQLVPVLGPNDLDAAFRAMHGADGLLQLDSLFFTTHRVRLVGLAAKSHLPAIYGTRERVDVGGLMSYGAHIPDLYRRAATYVDKILKGTKPADLPVEQPAKFELVINLKTAKALGLTIPPSLLSRADQVID